MLSFAAAVSASQQRCRGVAAPPPSLSSQLAWLLGVRRPEGGDGGTAFPDGLLCVPAVQRLSCFALWLLCTTQRGRQDPRHAQTQHAKNKLDGQYLMCDIPTRST